MNKKGKRFHENQNIDKVNNLEIIDVDDEQELDVDVVSKINEKSEQIDKPDSLSPQQEKQLSKREKQKIVKQNKKAKDKKEKEKKKISKKLNKKRQKLSKNDRKVLSYEDLPLDESGKDRIQKSLKNVRVNKKTIVKSLVIILILVIVVYVFSNSDRFTFSNIKNWVQYGIFNTDSDQQFPHDLNSAVIKDGNFTRSNSDLVYVSDTDFVTMNSWGRTIYTSQQTYSNPVLVTAADSDLSLVYNLGGVEFSINNIDSNIYKGEAQENILVADICENGTYALVTQKYGYLAKLYVYSPDNKQIFAYSFADYYITSVSLDSSGETAVLSGLSAHDGHQISAIYELDFTEEKPVFFKEINDNVIYHVNHLTDRYCCIIGESATYTLDTRKDTFTTMEYGGKSLTAFTVNNDTNTYSISLSRSGDGHMCDVLSFSTSGNLSGTVSTNLNVTSISSYKNRVALLSNDKVYLYSKDGSLISQTDAGLDPHSVVLYSKNDAYVLGVSEIWRLDL